MTGTTAAASADPTPFAPALRRSASLSSVRSVPPAAPRTPRFPDLDDTLALVDRPMDALPFLVSATAASIPDATGVPPGPPTTRHVRRAARRKGHRATEAGGDPRPAMRKEQ